MQTPRRRWLGQSLSLGLIQALATRSVEASSNAPIQPLRSRAWDAISFKSVEATQQANALVVPEHYEVQILLAWGDPVGVPGKMPLFRSDASNSAAEQALQAGMHHDGMHFFPLREKHKGLLVLNHEYVDHELLYPDGTKHWSRDKVLKSMAAHGVSIVEVRLKDRHWELVRPSTYARRITALSPMRLSGPAAGHRLMKTAADPSGTQVIGTFANCAHGFTPWGTYLTCEENWQYYFQGNRSPESHEPRWGIREEAWVRWHEFEPRFDLRQHPQEVNRFGWVVEIDPMDPKSIPIKRTALGRASREGATVVQCRDKRVVVYMGEDAAFQYIYKFVSRDPVREGGYRTNRHALDHGTLFVARFDADGKGRWLPLVFGQGPLNASAGFASQAEVLIESRLASEVLGATRMDRPEWIAVDPETKTCYVTLTNNRQRGLEGFPPVDAANPRGPNRTGHIIRWRESGDFDAEAFQWDIFLHGGTPEHHDEALRGSMKGDGFASADGLWFDPRGFLWVQTDMSQSTQARADQQGLGNNALLAADPLTGQCKRFLVGPAGCEITGAITNPELTTLFVNIQHPGEGHRFKAGEGDPGAVSNWPDGPGRRPRSATVAIRHKQGLPIGS
ncbi:MAG: PhoX family protein [Burkholderiaceae bacterium]|jgi:secreted PhoX family phosphatase